MYSKHHHLFIHCTLTIIVKYVTHFDLSVVVCNGSLISALFSIVKVIIRGDVKGTIVD